MMSASGSLSTIGKGYTLFAGTTTQDLFKAIQTGQASGAGQYWSLSDYLNNWLSAYHDQGLAAMMRWAWHNVGQASHREA